MTPVLPSAAPQFLLTISIGYDLHELVEDALLEHPEWAPGFTVSEALGHGSEARLVTASEKVRGHARQMLFKIIAPEAACRAILQLVGETVPGSGAFYWLHPVTEAGEI